MQHQFPIYTSFQRSKLDGGGVLCKRQKEKNSGYVVSGGQKACCGHSGFTFLDSCDHQEPCRRCEFVT